jgi:hypothetical protein
MDCSMIPSDTRAFSSFFITPLLLYHSALFPIPYSIRSIETRLAA